MCRKLLYRYTLLTYSDTSQFECMHTFDSMEQAATHALSLLHEYAEDHALAHTFEHTKSRRPPHSFLFPKNKSEEWAGGTKFRLLFSHFAHQMKVFGRLVGRALSLLIAVARDVLPTWAILRIPEVRDFVQRAQTHIHGLQGQPTHARARTRKRYKLFELDVREMFPRLPRDGELTAISEIAKAVQRAMEGEEWAGRIQGAVPAQGAAICAAKNWTD